MIVFISLKFNGILNSVWRWYQKSIVSNRRTNNGKQEKITCILNALLQKIKTVLLCIQFNTSGIPDVTLKKTGVFGLQGCIY